MSAPISASGSAARTGGLSPAAVLAAVTLAVLAAHLVVAAIAPLTEDEAYYRLWSMRPAWGYFDHPPMIAWWIWLGRRIAGDDGLGIRLLPCLAGAASAFLTWDLARTLGLAERTAARAGVWLSATVLMGLAGEMAVPDAPNTLFWIAALCCALRAGRGGHGAWWLAAGAMAGLDCLSKYSALFLAPGIMLWLALTAEGRRQLRTPWPWLAAVIALAIFAPNVAWNAAHGWLTFAKQFGRVEATNGFAPGYLAKLIFDQFLLLNPLVAVFVGLAIRRRAAWPLLAIGAPFAAYLVVHSLHDAVQGQWPAPLYPLAAIAASAAAEGARGWWAGLRAAAAPVGFALYAAALAFALTPGDDRWLPFHDPSAQFRGWTAFFQAVERTRAAEGAAWVGAPTYGIAAQLAASPAIHAPAAEFFERERYTFETPGERADFTKPGLILVPMRGKGGRTLRLCFADVRPLPELDRGVGAGTTVYAAFRVAQPRRDIERIGCYRPPEAKR